MVDIDELARRQGLGSDAELPLSELETPVESAESEQRSDLLDLSDFQLGVVPSDFASRSDEFAAQKKPAGAGDQEGASDSNYHVFLDDLAVPPGPVVASSSVMIGMSSVFSDLDYAPASSPKGGTGQAKEEDPLLATPELDRSGIADLANLAGDSDVLLVSPDSPTHSPVDSDVQLITDESSSSDSWEIEAEPLATTDGSSSSQEIAAFEPESGASISRLTTEISSRRVRSW